MASETSRLLEYDGDADIKSQSIDPDKYKPLFSRWQSFCGVCLYVSVAGSTYAFGIYSQLLRNNLGYTQESLDFIASVGNTGLYLSLLAGFSIERIGFRNVVLCGGTFIFVGFVYIWLAVTEMIPTNIYLVSFFYFLAQAGVCCHVTTAVTVSVKIFPPEARGAAIGLSKGYFGLSSALLGDLAGGYFETFPSTFLLFVAGFIPIMGYIGSGLANVLPPHLLSFDYERARGISTSLNKVIYHWFFLFFCLLLLGYIQYTYNLTSVEETISSLILIMIVFSILLLPHLYGDTILPLEDCFPPSNNTSARYNNGSNRSFQTFNGKTIKNLGKYNNKYRQEINKNLGNSDNIEINDVEANNNNNPNSSDDDEFFNNNNEDNIQTTTVSTPPMSSSLDSNQSKSVDYKYNNNNKHDKVTATASHNNGTVAVIEYEDCYYERSMPLSESIKEWRLWFLFFIFLVTCGAGLMVIYNVNAIAEAVNKEPSTFFVTLLALANGLGRVSAGFLSDKIVKNVGISKLQMLGIIVLSMSIAHFILSFGTQTFLFPCFLLVGFMFGCNVAITAVNVADLFGERYIATNFGCVDTAPIFGSYIFATWIVTAFYKDNTYNDEGVASCVGKECFEYSFLINGSVCLVGALACFYLHVYTPRT